MMNFNHVYYFHVVAVEGSIARAAQVLRVTQSTVSEQIREFERALDSKLFERVPGGLRLTEAGRQAYDHTRVMFQAAERLVGSFSQSSAETPLTFNVGIAGSVARNVAAGLLMPLITLDACLPSVRTGDLADLVRALRAGEVDLVLTETEPVESAMRGLRSVEVYRPRLVAVASPTRFPAEGEFDWSTTSLIHYRQGSAYRWEIDDWLDERGVHPPIAAETDDGLLMLEAVAQGAGVAFIPTSLARDALRVGRLRAVAVLEPSSSVLRATLRERERVDLAERAIERLRLHAQEAFAELP